MVGLGRRDLIMAWATRLFFYQSSALRPNRMREFDRLRYQQCEVECGYQSVQDSGRKIIEERCIANCSK